MSTSADACVDRAAGFIVVCRKRQSDGKSAFLVLQAHNHKTWTPPKGYVEGTEELLDAAKRELFEETGVKLDESQLQFDGRFFETRYTAWGRSKLVRYFLAWAKTDPCLQVRLSSEHIDYRWVTVDEYKRLQPAFSDLHEMMAESLTILGGEAPGKSVCEKGPVAA